ncbi:MAG: hypothetical protein PWQ55_521 [Chloroflexota bacterium]|nr:hypothetical protein [Chloroflexota bacterium]
MENWLRIDEEQQALLSLEFVNHQINKIEENLLNWEWVLIGIHNALQGFMVLALQGTDGLNVLNEKSAKEWMETYNDGCEKNLNLRLNSFPNLYENIQSPRMQIFGISEIFTPKGTQNLSVRQLNKYRNEFIHFLPKGWSIEISGFPRIVIDCIDIITFLAFDSNNILWSDDDQEQKVKQLCSEIKKIANALLVLYNGT